MEKPAPTISLNHVYHLSGVILVRTGLHIGVGRDTLEIGGVDSPVIKHPHSLEPYIPGSSIKGKVRCLMEWLFDCVQADGKVYGTAEEEYPSSDPILRIFGTTHKNWRGGPARALFADAPLNAAWRDDILNRGLPLTEDKAEVVIDRIQGKAQEGIGPRHMERVPAGAKFDLEILFKEYSVDGDGGATDRECLNWLLAGLRLLEQDALGGSGSRGYGRVKFTNLKLNGKDIQQKFDGIEKVGKDKPPVDFLAE